MQPDSEHGRLAHALRAIDALRGTLITLGDRASLDQAERLRAEVCRRMIRSEPVAPLSAARLSRSVT